MHKATVHHKKHIKKAIKISWWFSLGGVLGFFLFTSFLYILYQQTHIGKVYEGVTIDGVDFGGKTEKDVRSYFAKKNTRNVAITLTAPSFIATISAKQLNFGYNQDLLATQAINTGRSEDLLSNIALMMQGYVAGIDLPASYRYSDAALQTILAPLNKQFDEEPVDALFTFENGRVIAFRPSETGKHFDRPAFNQTLLTKLETAVRNNTTKIITIPLPIAPLKPAVTTESVNKLGIKELIGTGTSLFNHSIPNRIYNVNLAASRLNGVLIAPNETFSFTQTLGDVSAFTGYKQAYVIENGKTVLGDGGGVCQVSTTLFRAALSAGLPIIERHQHAYRVGYYEEDSPPGIDAAIYSPNIDLKFKNDTGHTILIQSLADLDQNRLTFFLYGTSDARVATINQPVILSESSAPDTLYQDDPTLPKGELKQVDFAAGGANVYFTRTVTRNGETLIADKFVSNYRPWQAIFLRGTGQ